MMIDQTRYKAFWQNPELYRLKYEKNLVAKAMAYGLSRGTAFHCIADLKAGGMPDDFIQAVLEGREPDPRGQTLSLSPDAIQNAWILWRVFEATYPPEYGIQVLDHEREFQVPIGAEARHFAVGRLDQIVMYQGDLWVGEMKTAYAKASYDKLLDDWNHNKQADFVMLGARSLGFEVKGVLVRYAVEKTPPVCFPPLEITRSEHALNLTLLNVHQTCEIIEMLRATFGIEQPWPHLSNWPCSVVGKCEHEAICGRASDEIDPAELEGFKSREEHLVLMRQ